MKKFLKIFILLFSIVQISFAIDIQLTKKEKEFIQNNTIKIGISPWKPISYYNHQTNQIDGISSEILNLVIQRLDLKTQIIPDNWKNTISNLENHTIDMHPSVYFTHKRTLFGLYNTPHLTIKEYLYIKRESKINGFTDLQNEKIAILKNYGTIEKIKKKYPTIQIIETNTLEESIELVLNGKAKALFGIQLVVDNYLNNNMITGLKNLYQTDFKPSSIHFFSNNQKPILNVILEKGLNSITIEEKNNLISKYLLQATKTKNDFYLTKNEKKYLKDKKVIKMCIDPNWMPYEKIEDNKHIGISADYIALFSKSLNIKIELVPTKTWTESKKYIKNRICDILPLASNTQNRKKYMNFSQPYIVSPIVIATKVGLPFIHNIEEILNKKIGITSGYATIKKLKKRYPNINLIEIESLEDGLKKVKSGELFGYLDNAIALNYLIQKSFFNSISISGKFQNTDQLSIATRNDEPILKDIFDKAILSVDKVTKESILNKWTSIQYERIIDYSLVYKVIAISISIFLTILYFLIKLNKLKNKLKILASTDPMTKLYNRRYFIETSEILFDLAKRNTTDLSIIMIDIDDFKFINDTYGHKTGDDVIISLSNILQTYSRKSDLICRWGGEEFIILLPNTNTEGALVLAHTLLKETNLLIMNLTNNKNCKFTISLGISKIENIDLNIDNAILKADKALYEAKNTGKNKACLFKE